MKKSYLLALGLGVSIVSFGQKKIVQKKPAHTGLSVDVTSVKGHAPQINKAAGDVFYTEDFNGSISDWTTSGQDAAIWLFDTDGPDGQYSSATNADIITSTTAGNGFMMFDADFADPTAPFVDKQGSLVSPIIDLTGRPSVSLRFQHAYRTCCTAAFYPKLEVTTDGFLTFTTFDVTATGIGVNDFSGTVAKEVNLDAFIAAGGDVAQFQFRFNFDGVSNSTSHYFWQIDDVELFEPNNYSLEAHIPVWGSTGYWEAQLPYSMVPMAQIAPIDYAYIVENKGSETQSDIVLETTIPEGPFSDVGPVTEIPAFTTDTVNASTSFTPAAALGVYNPTFVVSSSHTDVDPSDNVGSAHSVEITSGVYARDMVTVDGGTYNQGQGFEVGNIFDMYSASTIRSGSFWVRSTSNPGASVYMRLYSIDAASGDFVFMTESDLYTISDADLGTLLTLPFLDVATLDANQSYLIVAGSFGDGGATDDLIVGTSGASEAQTTFYFDMTDQTWYYTTNTPIVRMNLGTAPLISSNDPGNNLCEGETLVLTSDAATGNVWSPGGETTQSITVSAAGTYSTTVNGEVSNSITVTTTTIDATAMDTGIGNLTVAEANATSYQWVDCNNGNAPVAGATSQNFMPTANGSYAVIITKNGCTETSNCVIFDNVSIAELGASVKLSVYPNPANDKIAVNFNLNNEAAVTLELRDLNGKMISSKTMGKAGAGVHTVEFDTRAVSNGVYVMNLVTKGETSAHKVVINH